MRRRGVTPKTRFRIMRRDGFKCCLCGRGAKDGVELQVDHKIAFSRGGSDKDGNLWTLCQPCNSGKSASPIPTWESGHPRPRGRVTVFSEEGDALTGGEIVWFDLPNDDELDGDKIMDFDRYIMSEYSLNRFMRRLSRWDMPQDDTEKAASIREEFQRRDVRAVIINQVSKLPGLRFKTFVPGVLVDPCRSAS